MKTEQPSLFDLKTDYRKELKPSRTAIRRKEASPVARGLVGRGFLNNHNIAKILDYGCGVGQDVLFYRGCGLDAVGYDPHEPFGWSKQPVGPFDMVSCLFVFNVVSNADERAALARTLLSFAKTDGVLVVATRSPKAIQAEARRKAWKEFRDGYLSSPSRGTFQRGISEEEILSYFGSNLVKQIPAPLDESAGVCLCAMLKI